MRVDFSLKALLLTLAVFAAIGVSGWLGLPSYVAVAALALITAFELVSFFGTGESRRHSR